MLLRSDYARVSFAWCLHGGSGSGPSPDSRCRYRHGGLCGICARWSRGYLRHLLAVGEHTASRLVTIHNVAWPLALVRSMGDAIREGRLAALRPEVLELWV